MAFKPKPIARPRWIRMAMVAHSGFGKTVFAGTAPNALFLTTDPEGAASAMAFGSDAREVEIHDEAELVEAYEALEAAIDDEKIIIDGQVVEWLIVDNLTECQEIFMGEAMRLALIRKPDRSKYVPDKHEYLTSQNAVIDMVKKFASLPVNIIFTIHMKGMEDGDGNDYYSAAIQGRQGEVAQMILGYMNVVAMGKVVEFEGKSRRRFYFDHVREFRGKDRFNKLGRYQDDLDVPTMMHILFETERSRPRPRPRPRAA